MSQTIHEAMRAHGIATPAHQQTVDDAMRAGIPFQKIIDWVKSHGPGILSLVQEILALTGKTTTAVAGGTQTHPSPPVT